MKIVQGYGPAFQGPYVPALLSSDLGIFRKDGKPADGNVVPCSPFQIDEHEWIGIKHDGKIETFKRSDEYSWKSKASHEAIQYALHSDLAPEIKLEILNSAALLMGVQLPNLVSAIDGKRNEGESLPSAFERLRKSGDLK